MKFPCSLRVILVLAAVAAGSLARVSGETSRDEILNSFKEPAASFGPVAPPEKEKPKNPDSASPHADIVYMDPLEITESYRDVEAAVKEYDEVLRAQKFHLESGGTIIKKVGKKVTREIKCKFEPRYQKWDIIKFSW